MIGDYRIGETLLAESAMEIELCSPPAPAPSTTPPPHHFSLLPPDLKLPSLSNMFSRSRTPSPEPSLTPLPAPPTPRRMVIVVVGLKPHRAGIWTSSQRPGESVIKYQLLNGCPALVVPVKVGAPLVSWDCLTLEDVWKVQLPADEEGGAVASGEDGKFEGMVGVFYEYLDLCIDWQRVIVKDEVSDREENAKEVVRDAIRVLVAAAIRSGESAEVKKEIDKERSGIAMWRIP
jgi:hypothetical protein